MYEAIILAGGFGTRLRDAVPDLPKPMAPVAGKPFLAWQIEYLTKCGVTHFILSVGYKAQIIRDYFGSEFSGSKITYAEETEPLGTGGAIQFALKHSTQERVFVLNGDSLCQTSLVELRSLSESTDGVGIVVKHVENAGRYGAITFDKSKRLVTSFGEKSSSAPGFINAGIYDIPTKIFDDVQDQLPFAFETSIIQKLVSKNLYACESGDFFIDIGIPEDFIRAQTDIPLQFKNSQG
jgi:D-glycero-alpha-D-manno-heptose 1-phosphate guanylyltransferase